MTQVMGIVNVTPDSFSDGGHHDSTDTAVAHAVSMIDDGAHIVDVGGESTRPGSAPVDEATELARVVPVIEGVRAARPDAIVSVDTTKVAVATAGVAAGASIINDVSASLEATAADLGVGWIAMHAGGPSATMQDDPRYVDVVGEVFEFLADAVARGRSAGVERIWVDPGFGFGKTLEHNLALVADIDRFATLAPVLLGVSRKATIGELHRRSDAAVAGAEDAPVPPDDRLEGSLAMATYGAFLGVDIVRVHDVRATVHAVGVIRR